MADQVTGTGRTANGGDTAAGFGATAETNDNNDQINQLLDQVRDLLIQDGRDAATAEALTNFARPAGITITGNYADLQRMGQIINQGRMAANSQAPGNPQEEEETSNIEDAFRPPPPPNLAPAGLQTPMGTIDEDGNPTGGTTDDEGYGDSGEEGDGGVAAAADTGTADTGEEEEEEEEDLSSMTKAELEAEAEARGVRVSSSMTKQEMIDAIEAGGEE